MGDGGSTKWPGIAIGSCAPLRCAAGRMALAAPRAACGGLLCGWFRLVQQGCGGGYAVAIVEAEQANALSGAASFTDFTGVDANDFAVAGDDHYVGLFVHLERGYYCAVAFGGLEVNYAFAAAAGYAIFGERGALAVTLFGDGEHQ